jgi:hypothetical protein
MNPGARRFVLLALGLAGALAGGLVLLNYAVDPYNRFGHNRLGIFISADRECKPALLRNYSHNALLVGNSRIGAVRADQLNSFRFFNGALPGATSEEIYYFLQHFAHRQEMVILGIDLGACDPLTLKGDIFVEPGCTAHLNNLFNLQTVEYSVRTVLEHFAGRASPMRVDGSAEIADCVPNADVENPALREWQLERMKRVWDQFSCPPKDKMSYYGKIADCLRERGIPFVVVVVPLHEEIAKYLQTPNFQAASQAWLANLKSIFPNVVDLSFSRYGAAQGFFRSDPAHFKSEVGVRLLNTEVIPVASQLRHRNPPQTRSPVS